MKKLNWNSLVLLLIITGLSTFNSCKEDDKDTPKPQGVNYKVGTTTFTVSGKKVTIKDLGNGISTYKMYADTTYILDGFVFVNENQVLTVEPGTMIQGKPGESESASALIVAKGGKMMAEGTAEKPIVLTAEGDTYTGEGSNLGLTDKGIWGGLKKSCKEFKNYLEKNLRFSRR